MGHLDEVRRRHYDMLSKTSHRRLSESSAVRQRRVDEHPAAEEALAIAIATRIDDPDDLAPGDVRELERRAGHTVAHEQVETAERAREHPEPDLGVARLRTIDGPHLEDLRTAMTSDDGGGHLLHR